MRRPLAVAVGLLLGLILVAAVWRAWPSPPRETPPPGPKEWTALARRAPNAFRSRLAVLERVASSPTAPPLAIGIADGAAIRITLPPNVSGGHYNCALGQLRADGTYISPRVPLGHTIETARYSAGSRDLRLVLAGQRGTARYSDGFAYDVVAAEGATALRDLGPLRREGTRYILRAPGSTSDGFGIAQGDEAPPRRIALAPDELPRSAVAEPGGYSLLFDEVLLWRKRGTQSSSIDLRIPMRWMPSPLNFYLGKAIHLKVEEADYRVSTLAHVYRRTDGRWRYSRSWSLDGHGTAYSVNDEANFSLYRRAVSGSPPAFGVPNAILPSRVLPVPD